METSGEAPWLSVVTVSLHEDDHLIATLDSIDHQGASGVERVVVLGERPSIELSDRLSHERAAIVVQEPAGIYPAMNAGAAAAGGSLLHFLNAGDAYADSQVLGSVRGSWERSGFAWAYGRMIVTDSATGREHVRGVTLDRMRRKRYRGLNFPELPTVFMGRTMLQDLGGFDVSYRIAADYRLMLDAVTTQPGVDLDLVVARYALGGVSDTEWRESLSECQRARREVIAPKGADALGERWFSAGSVAVQAIRRTPRTLARMARL
jgi:glycosyltransferase